MTAVVSETSRVIESITAVLSEMTPIRALNSGFGCFDAILQDDLLRGIACGIKCLPVPVGGLRYNVKLKNKFSLQHYADSVILVEE